MCSYYVYKYKNDHKHYEMINNSNRVKFQIYKPKMLMINKHTETF